MEKILGKLQKDVDRNLKNATNTNLLSRIWEHDYTVWADNPEEISNRLGWLHLSETMLPGLDEINHLVNSVISDGYTHVLLLGMGGSSLAPEVYGKIFGVKPGFLQLAVLDSTDPGAVQADQNRFDPEKTLYIVSTKSGGTEETLSFFKYFYNLVENAVGSVFAGKHFIAITDPGSKLVNIAEVYKFRHTFLNDPNIGGRYSALSYFGLVPAALVGIDLEELLSRARVMTAQNSAGTPYEQAPGVQLGTIMGTAALTGRDKITFTFSPGLEPFGDWVEQLIAESLGKSGKGILPVVGERLGEPGVYGTDRLFVSIRYKNTPVLPEEKPLVDNANPWITLFMQDEYDLGAQFMLWEIATAIAGHVLGVHPFNQPDVESAKVEARSMVQAYSRQGTLPAGEYASFSIDSLKAFLDRGKPGDYVGIHAYLQPTDATRQILEDLRLQIRDKFHLATTLGFGPRFLHSTGQLHKGDAGHGLFIQFISKPAKDLPIPIEAGKRESDISFGVLKQAQALGDAQALRCKGRRLISFLIDESQVSTLKEWAEKI